MSRIKEYPSITSFDGTNDALAIEQTDGASNRTRKVTPAQLKQYMEAGDFEATGEIKDGHGNVLNDVIGGAVIKRFYINNGNTSLDTGINVNQTHTTGFVAIVSTFGTHNAGVASAYIGGVAHRRQDGTVGDLNYARLGGVGIGGSQDSSNMQFSVVNDKLQLKTYQYQVGACITLILSKRN